MQQYKSILQCRIFGTCVLNYRGKNFEQCVGFTASKMWEIFFVNAFGDSSVSRATIFREHSQFGVGEESIDDTERSGRPGTLKTNENITRAAVVLKDNRHASCRMIAENMRIPKTIVHCILSDDLKK